MWDAVEKVIPNARNIAEVRLEGSPLTHEKFLNVHRGTYGPVTDAKAGFSGMPPGQKQFSVAEGLWTCGHTSFPGIGVPAVAASGWLAANAMSTVDQQESLLRRIGLL